MRHITLRTDAAETQPVRQANEARAARAQGADTNAHFVDPTI
jgi:hypothetical protein